MNTEILNSQCNPNNNDADNRDVIISVEHLSKVYKLYDHPKYRLIEAFHPLRKQYHKKFYALNDISFNVKRGETIGIIGKNGSGKSTLLQILTGVLTPTCGTVKVKGRVSALLELGAGFNPQFTGIENVYFQGSLMGFTRKEMDAKLDDILAFADIGEFDNQPIRMYSSGMYVRLAFAVAINVDPEILIVDEALAVGDMRFQQKCIRKMRSMMENGKTVLFVTHDIATVNNFCNTAIWLNEGLIKETGDTDQVTKKYISYMAYGMETVDNSSSEENQVNTQTESSQHTKWMQTTNFEYFGTLDAIISEVKFVKKSTNNVVTVIQGGETVIFYARIEVRNEIISPGLGILIKDRIGNNIFTINNYAYNTVFQS